jgi:hypothetical protein
VHRRFAWAIGGVCLVWAYGLFVHHHMTIRTPRHRVVSLAVGSGAVYVEAQRIVGSTESAPPPRVVVTHRARWTAGSDPFRSPVFRYHGARPMVLGGTISRGEVGVPLWLVAAALLVVPSARLVRGRLAHGTAARRRAAGLCVTCGYDLRGSPGRCPECGPAAELPGAA